MKNLKLLGLAAIAAMALMAFAASSASATALYNGTTKLKVGDELDFSLKAGTSALLVNTEGGELDKCSGSTLKGSITNAGGASATVSGNIADEVKEGKTVTGLTWTGCTFPTVTVVSESFEIHQIFNAFGEPGTEGTFMVKKSASVTVNTPLFGTCGYGFTELGRLTTFRSGTAELHVSAIGTKASGSNFACPETSKLTGTYVGTTPDNLRVEAS